MTENHPKADAFANGVKVALDKFNTTVEGAPPEKSHKPDAEEFVKDVEKLIQDIWAE